MQKKISKDLKAKFQEVIQEEIFVQAPKKFIRLCFLTMISPDIKSNSVEKLKNRFEGKDL